MQPDDIAHADQARKENPFLTTAGAGTYGALPLRTAGRCALAKTS